MFNSVKKIPRYGFNFLISNKGIKARIFQRIFKKMTIIPYKWRLHMGQSRYPYYHYCVYQAAVLAKQLNYSSISVFEFGCAKGNGLRELEKISLEIKKIMGIEIEVYGFDTGEGLPAPEGIRDLKHCWKEGDFKMDRTNTVFKYAKLVLGNISDTKIDFFEKYKPAPVGAVFFDFDYYSSTKEGMDLLLHDESKYLPRVYSYFDDIIGTELELYNDFTGERLAINEFNQENLKTKFSKAYHLICREIIKGWYHKVYILHRFDNSKYQINIEDNQNN
jgi:hypothetical protein